MEWIEKSINLLSFCRFDMMNTVFAKNLVLIPVLCCDDYADEYLSLYNHLGQNSGIFYDICYNNLSLMICFSKNIEMYICANYKEFTLDNDIPDNQLATYYNQLRLN